MRTLLLAVLAILIVGVSGCSGGDGGGTTPNPSTSKADGQSCSASSECSSGLCFGGACVTPTTKPPSGSGSAENQEAPGSPAPKPPGNSGPSAASAPTATLTTPADLATDVSVNTKIVVTFSEEMDAETITAGNASGDGTFHVVSLANPGTAIAPLSGNLSCNNPCTVATFTPSPPLNHATMYMVVLDSLRIKSKKDATLAPFVDGTFTTQ